MNILTRDITAYLVLSAVGILLSVLFPAYITQIGIMFLMIILAQTWDLQGGQMGYNSLGNIFFFGIGMYASIIFQISSIYGIGGVGDYTAAAGSVLIEITFSQYMTGLVLGAIFGGVIAVIFAFLFGQLFFALRGPYFAIGTLGMVLAAAEYISAWEWVGAGGGVSLPNYPSSDPTESGRFFFYAFVLLSIATFVLIRWLLHTRFGLALNAIRDDEGKAEGMGIRTLRYKVTSWMVSAFFLGIAGSLFGNMSNFIEPLELAFPTVRFGIFMVVMALLGGKGTVWGPVLGAIVFHVIQETTWTYMLGTQWIALGVLIIVIVIFFNRGIMGSLEERYPHWFGIRIEGAKDKETNS
jgi:branched-chain amino acid transport system permease protein